MKHLPVSKQIAFSIGQLGWSLLSGLVVSYLVYFFHPTHEAGLPYYVKVLLKLPESMITVLFIAMTAASLIFYIPINFSPKHIGKKKMICAAFVLFAFTYLMDLTMPMIQV